jgi:hypothetical protein
VATYKIAGDGHHYLIHGYPVLDKRGQQAIRPIQKDLTIFVRAVYLRDVFETLMPQFNNALEALSLASWLCIFRHRHSSKSSKAG